MSSEAAKKMIVLKASDDETFEVEEAVALQSQTIKHMIEDDCADTVIPLPNVNSKVMAKVIEYCRRHVAAEAPSKAAGKEAGDGEKGDEEELKRMEEEKKAEEGLREFDAEFVKVEQDFLFDLILAANYLNIKSLLDLMCQAVADLIKDKMPEEVRTLFGIKNDFTAEEEEAVRSENSWSFE